MKNLIDEFKEIYRCAVNIEYALGTLQRAEEQSLDFYELEKEHIYEMSGALELVKNCQGAFVNRMSDLVEELERELKKLGDSTV